MESRERVIQVIEHRKPDRIPLYGWVIFNLKDEIEAEWGSVAAFEDAYEFDLSHIFAQVQPYDRQTLRDVAAEGSKELEPEEVLDFPMTDPNDMSRYESAKNDVEHHKTQRGRFVYVQTPGCFEFFNGLFSIENHLMYLMLYEDELMALYDRLADWTIQFASNCLDLGVDMIHVSDDWGSQHSLLFSPEKWRTMVYPYHKKVADAVKKRGGYLSLHSDGNVNQALDGIVDIGYDVIHPYQESAGMDLGLFKSKYRDRFSIMGGLDVQTTVGFGKIDFLKTEIKRITDMFRDGGLILCTSHMIQAHCSMEELRIAFDTAYELVRHP